MTAMDDQTKKLLKEAQQPWDEYGSPPPKLVTEMAVKLRELAQRVDALESKENRRSIFGDPPEGYGDFW